MTEIEGKIVDSAIRSFLRFGAKKTSMAEIAAGAGVSRQTVYDQFGNKDAIIVASIRHLTAVNLAAVRERLAACDTLEDQLSAYSDDIASSFRMLQESSDAQDLIVGHNDAGKAEMNNSRRKHEALIGEILSPYADEFQKIGVKLDQYAHFYVAAAMSFKYTAQDEEDLISLTDALVNATLKIAQGDGGLRKQ